MSYANKFLGTNSQDLTDGTIDVFAASLCAKNLISTSDIPKINSAGCLYPASINIDDITGLQAELDATIQNPLASDLNANNFDITNASSIQVTNGANNVTLNYITGTSNTTLDIQTLKDIEDVTQNFNISTSPGQTDVDGDLVVTGDIQAGGALIGGVTITDVDILAQSTTLSISGTVTANAGTNLNTAALALESGGNLDTITTNTTGIALESGNLAAINTNTAALALESGGVLDTIQTNTAALALESGGVLDTIDSKTSAIVSSTSLTASATSSIATTNTQINNKTPALGQTTAANSSPAVLSSDYLSTATVDLTNVEKSNGSITANTLRVNIATDDILLSQIQNDTNVNLSNTSTIVSRLPDFSVDTGVNDSGSIRVVKAENSNKFYVKGYEQALGTTLKTIGTSTFNNISLLSANTQLQVSSTSASDTVGTLTLFGYNSSFAAVTANYVLTGTTPVTVATQFFRINRMQWSHTADNVGTIYVSPNGAATTGGVPNSASDYLYSMKPGDNVSHISQGVVPYIAGKNMQPKRVVFSLTNDSLAEVEIDFQLKYTNASIWQNEFKFWIDEQTNTQFQFDLDGIPQIPNNDPSKGIDIRTRAIRSGTGNVNLSTAVSVEMI